MRVRFVAFIVLVVLLCGGPAGAVGWLAYSLRSHEDAVALRRAEHEKQFLEERARTNAMPFLAPIGDERDAGELLNKLVPWRDNEPNACAADPSALDLTDDTKQAYGGKIVDLVGKDLPPLPAAEWMSLVHRYDHWNIDMDARVAGRRPLDLGALPDWSTLIIYAKARLLGGLVRANDVTAASRDVQQLARLLISSEVLVAAMVGTSLLTSERALYDGEVAKGRAPNPDWHPLTLEEIQLIRRVAAAGFEYAEVEAPATMSKIIDGSSPLDCLALHENMVAALEYRPLAQDVYADSYARFDALAGDMSRCRFLAARVAWHEPDMPFNAAKLACRADGPDAPCIRYILARIPLIHHLAVHAFIEGGDDDGTRFVGLNAYEPTWRGN